MVITDLYRSFLKDLSTLYSNEEASVITSLIFEHFMGIDRAAIIKEPGRLVDEKIIPAINASLEELLAHKPVQYITGEAWFYKIKLKVSPAVLIPRPETEELAELVIHEIKNRPFCKIIDIGTGSGCLAIAIKKEVPSSLLTALDSSGKALDIAKENAAKQFTKIHFIDLDFLDEKSYSRLEKYHVIVSNPPYIPLDEKQTMSENVTGYEPHEALFVNSGQPLLFYEKIVDFAKDHLLEKGMVFLETHEDFADAVGKLFDENLYKTVVKKDLSGKQRMVVATRAL